MGKASVGRCIVKCALCKASGEMMIVMLDAACKLKVVSYFCQEHVPEFWQPHIAQMRKERDEQTREIKVPPQFLKVLDTEPKLAK